MNDISHEVELVKSARGDAGRRRVRHAAEEAFRLEVAPAIAELEEQTEATQLTHQLRYPKAIAWRRRAGRHRRTAVAQLGLVGAVSAAVPAIVGAALGVAGDVGAAMVERLHKLAHPQRENAYFFLYRAKAMLAS